MFFTGSIGYLLMFSGFNGVLFTLILILKKRPASYYFFSLSFFILSYTTFLLGAIKTNLIVLFPHLFLTAQPLIYLIGPASFYFIFLSINPYHRLRPWELLHLLPFALHTLELVTFFGLSSDVKIELIQAAYQPDFRFILEGYGLHLSYFKHLFLKNLSIFLYASFGLWYMSRHYKKVMTGYRNSNKPIYYWLSIEVTFKLLISLAGMSKSIWNLDNKAVESVFSFILSADNMVCLGFILLNPKILEGASPASRIFPNPPEQDQMESGIVLEEPATPDKEQKISLLKDNKTFLMIESYLQSQKPFLNTDFSREFLSSRLKISERVISLTVKSATGLSFPDYINSYRLHHLEENFNSHSDWKKYSVEAIAYEIGFSNRISFFNAVRRLKKMTPSEFLASFT